MTEVEKFNFLFEEFIDKLITLFDNAKLRSYRRTFIMMKGVQQKTPANIFMAGCVQYKEQIKRRDSNFILNDSSVNEKSKYFGNFTDDCGLNNYWNELTSSTQNAIWEYIQSLFVLAEIIVNKNKALYEKYSELYISDYKDQLKEAKDNNGNFSSDFLKKINIS